MCYTLLLLLWQSLDRVGIQDFVLLDETTETAFLSNLNKRFSKDLIYTYIGTLLVSVNPYKEVHVPDLNNNLTLVVAQVHL
uniref:Myosin motor domain-containing protein n=1 Tax=Seriola lalandi dorsalis TaxID=1841481 RepID=A0A3B4WXD0_SERLL